MRHIKFRLVPTGEALHEIEAAIAEHPKLERKAIHHLDVLEDGSVLILYELVGKVEDGQDVIEHPGILSYSISQVGDSIFSYTRIEANETTKRIFQTQREHDLIVDYPIYYSDNGALNISIIGELETINAAARSLPDTVDVELLKVGNYVPDEEHRFYQLTERQQEVLRAAVELGYYQDPRHITYEDIAEVVDLAPGTVGEHLRKIEAQVFEQMIPDR